MEQQTLDLLRALQSKERDAGALSRIQALLASERSKLVASDDRATLADVSEMLEEWADTAAPALGAQAVAHAAVIADQDLQQAERAVQLYVLALEREPTAEEPLALLIALLTKRAEHERLETILSIHAKTLAQVDPERAAAVLVKLAQQRKQRGDLDAAIETAEQALDLAASAEVIRALADLYAERGTNNDAEQAAELYCTLGEALGDSEGVALLERALVLAPSHDAALDLLESYVSPEAQPKQLKPRWIKYIERSDNEEGIDKRRLLLARAHAADGAYREALICLGPLIEKGDSEATRLQAAFLANLHESEPSSAGASGGAKPSTLVGFRLPTGEGVPTVAGPAPPLEEAIAAAKAKHKAAAEAQAAAGGARNAWAARSGETLVGFRVPTAPSGDGAKPSDANAQDESAAQAPAGAQAAASQSEPAAKPATTKPAKSTGGPAAAAAALKRESVRAADKPAPAESAIRNKAAAPAAHSNGSNGAAKSAAAAATAASPSARAAALKSSAGTSNGARARSSAVAQAQAAAAAAAERVAAATSGQAQPQGALALAAALKSRTSHPPAAAATATPHVSSSPPPLRTSSAAPGAFAAATAAASASSAFAQAATPHAQAAAEVGADATQEVDGDEVATTALMPFTVASTPMPPSALGGFESKAKGGGFDRRWLVVGLVVVGTVGAGAAWSALSGPATPPASAAGAPTSPPPPAEPAAAAAVPAAAAAVPGGAAEPAAAAQAAPAAAAAATAPATPTAAAPAPGATALLAAAVATPTVEAPKPARKAPQGTIKLGNLRVRGGLSEKSVSGALDDSMSALESCYTDALDRDAKLSGKLTFTFTVSKSGEAGKVRKQSGTIKNSGLLKCTTEALESTRFAKAKKKAAQVTLPLTYSRK